MIPPHRTRLKQSAFRLALKTLSSISRVRPAASRRPSALVLGLALACQALLLPLASLAQPNPLAVAANDPNKRYLVYKGQKTALIGVSGEYLPHVPRLRRADGFALLPSQSVKHQESCNYDLIGAVQVLKYKRCIDKLYEAGLNKMRLYVSLNHSPGKLDTQLNPDATVPSQPYDREQTFAWDGGQRRWNLDLLDNSPGDPNSYFKRLREVVSYAQDKNVIVEVTLFDPWDGTFASSPWNSANNFAAGRPAGVKFTSEVLYAQGDKDFAYDWNLTTLIDANADNQKMRGYQVKIMQAAVDALVDPNLPPLDNFYWELANEADRKGGVIAKQFLNWHYYMAHQLRDYERKKTPGFHHLIAVNFSDPAPIDGLLANATARQYIDIINGHYVHIGGYAPAGQLPNLDNPPAPFGAFEILYKYNRYSGSTSLNNVVWGFDEGHITGIDGDPNDHHSVRAEAWEFMFGGGGSYDHLGYRWAHLNNTFNRTVADKTRENLSYLKRVMGEISDLGGMRRNSSWIANPPVYGKALTNVPGPFFWSAMKNADTFLYYGHHSAHSTGSFPRYVPATNVQAHTERLTVQKLGSCTQNYTAEWLRPDNHDATTGALIPAPTPVRTEGPFSWSPGETRLLRLRNYKDFDVALRVKRTSSVCGSPSTVPGPNVALAANGGVASASSSLAGYPPRSVNDGVRTAANWGSGGGWNDATESVYPDWVRVDFNGLKTISEIDVVTLQDNYASGVQPTTDELFSFYGITDYELEYLDDTTGAWEPLGGVTGNRNVWRKFKFESVTTRAIRVVVSATMYPSPTSYSRVVEIEAY